MTANTHVVFGTGPAGRAVADALVSQDVRVRIVNRGGRQALAGVETIGGDATSLEAAKAADAKLLVLGTRAAMSNELLDAHHPGQVRVVIGRASRLVGPEARDSAFGARFFDSALGDIVTRTLDWYRADGRTPELSPGLADATTLLVTS